MAKVDFQGRLHTRDLTSDRMMQVRAQTLDSEAMTVQAVLTTDAPTIVFDWRTLSVVDEVLLMDGMVVHESRQVPFLESHMRYSTEDVIGSVRGIGTTDTSATGIIHFSKSDEAATRVFRKYEEGHLTDVSVGYRVLEFEDIKPGKIATIAGRKFKAGDRTLRVTTKWQLKEVSAVAIGADAEAKVRGDDPRSLSTEAEQMPDEIKNDAGMVVTPTETRSDPDTTPDIESVRKEAREAERKRVAEITDLARRGEIDDDTLKAAIDSGESVEKAGKRFYDWQLSQRQPAAPQSPAGVHVHEKEMRSDVYAAALCMREGLDWNKLIVDGKGDAASKQREQLADAADKLRGVSVMDVCEAFVRRAGKRWGYDKQDNVRVAVSIPEVSKVFSTSVNTFVQSGYMLADDTTNGWVDEENVSNFQMHDLVSLTAGAGRLEKLPAGGTAKHGEFKDRYEQARAHRFAKQLVFDEQNMIDDRFSLLAQGGMKLGESARQVRPNMVYTLLLANATLVDTGALFNATAETTTGGHANLTTTAISGQALRAIRTSMGKKRENDIPLNLTPGFLIIPFDIVDKTERLLSSREIRSQSADGGLEYAVDNTIANWGLQLRVDDRIGATGVTDPVTGTAYTGTAANFFVSARGFNEVVALYVNGNRTPQVRSFVLDRGQYGMGWDIKLDIGVGVKGYRGLHKSTGAVAATE